MIQQPELGKKIAAYRKAKGFTQEELVEKCNLSVRTLQRIEAGEVTPRISTVKLIFEALELEMDNSFVSPAENDKGLIVKLFGEFYGSLMDLFHLKTNTMKKISIITIVIAFAVIGIFTINNDTIARVHNSPDNDNYKNSHKEVITDTSGWYSYFQSEESFYDNNDLIARNVKFTSHGVTIASSLIKVDKKTCEFITAVASGEFAEDKVEIFVSNGILKKINYSSDMIDTSYHKIHLRGNAKVDLGDNSFIEAQEIIITTKE